MSFEIDFSMPLRKALSSKPELDEEGRPIRWVEGIASLDDWEKDLQGHTVDHDGLDTSLLELTKSSRGGTLPFGSFIWDHNEGPGDYVGNIYVSKKLSNGDFYVKGRLHYGGYADEIWNKMEDNPKSHGFCLSLHGKTFAADGSRLTKTLVTKVAITDQPIKTKTWFDIAKSVRAGSFELQVNKEQEMSFVNDAQKPGIEGFQAMMDSLLSGRDDGEASELKKSATALFEAAVAEQVKSAPAQEPAPKEDTLGVKVEELMKSLKSGVGDPLAAGIGALTMAVISQREEFRKELADLKKSVSAGVNSKGEALLQKILEKLELAEETPIGSIRKSAAGGVVPQQKSQSQQPSWPLLDEKEGAIFLRPRNRQESAVLQKSLASALQDNRLSPERYTGYATDLENRGVTKLERSDVQVVIDCLPVKE